MSSIDPVADSTPVTGEPEPRRPAPSGAGDVIVLVDVVGTDRLVMRTNFAGWDQQDSMKKGADLPMLADNARRLLASRRRDAHRVRAASDPQTSSRPS